jgi:hypothetical protein
MKNHYKLIAIIALVAVIGFSFAACDDGSTGGGDGGGGGGRSTFTLTGIPSKYNGRPALLTAGNSAIAVMSTGSPTVSNGTVITSLTTGAGDYTGNDILEVRIQFGGGAGGAGVIFDSVKFTNGSATRAWSAADTTEEW